MTVKAQAVKVSNPGPAAVAEDAPPAASKVGFVLTSRKSYPKRFLDALQTELKLR